MTKYLLLTTTLLMTLGAACAALRVSRPDVARSRAEQDYGCSTVEISETETLGARSVFAAKGCDKSGTYVVHCMAGSSCTAYSESEWERKEARLNAVDVSYTVVNECRDRVYLHDAGNDRAFELAPGARDLLVGKAGDLLELTDDAGTILYSLAVKEEDRTMRVTSACVTLAYAP